jgi:hypothetical protein
MLPNKHHSEGYRLVFHEVIKIRPCRLRTGDYTLYDARTFRHLFFHMMHRNDTWKRQSIWLFQNDCLQSLSCSWRKGEEWLVILKSKVFRWGGLLSSFNNLLVLNRTSRHLPKYLKCLDPSIARDEWSCVKPMNIYKVAEQVTREEEDIRWKMDGLTLQASRVSLGHRTIKTREFL